MADGIPEIDGTKLAAELIRATAKSVFSSISGVGKSKYEDIQADFELCFRTYLERSFERHSRMKTILYRDIPKPLERFFVAPDVAVGKTRKISMADIATLIQHSRRKVLVGTAGSGKSTCMKYLFIRLVEEKSFGIPILVELRRANEMPEFSLMGLVVAKTLQEIGQDITEDQVKRSFERGKIVLILDGLDEVNADIRESVIKSILDFSRRYPSTRTIVSSRPSEVFASWQNYWTYRLQPLSKDQAVSLVEKLDYDRATREAFARDLRLKLYEKHEEFLSNPLLLTMMLMTYEQVAEIPAKMHLFYEQVFEVLFHKHDALKELYRRKTYSNLPIDEFRRLLAAFSISSYLRTSTTFSRAQALRFIGEASNLTGVDVDEARFLQDLLESVCLLQYEGLDVTYSHRSFQEYFSAVFLSSFESPRRGELLVRIARRSFSSSDSVLSILFDLNPGAVEKELVIPSLQRAVAPVKGGIYRPLRVLDRWFSGVHISGTRVDVVLDVRDTSFSHWILIVVLKQLYPAFLTPPIPIFPRDENVRRQAMQAFGAGSSDFHPLNKAKRDFLKEHGWNDWVNATEESLKRFLASLERNHRAREKNIEEVLFGP